MKIILIVTAAFFAMLSVAAAADLPIGKYPVGAAARPAPARPGAFGPGERGGGRVAPEGAFGGGVTGGLPGGVVSGGRAPVAPEQPECPIAEGAGEKPPAGVAHGEEREAGGGGAPEHTLQPPADGQPGCALARFVGSIGLAAAQQPTPPADAQQQSQQEKAQQTPSGKMGAEEPSSHTPNAKPQENAVFVNGALAVLGAPANTDTVPAKFSAKNAADDELITVAYTFKTLTDDERRAIYQALKGQPYSAFNADVGTEVPPGIELRPVPNEVAARVPQTRDYRYTVANDRVLLVGTNRIVVGVFAAAPTHP
jgi:Protein of unknown function (DUF1236)